MNMVLIKYVPEYTVIHSLDSPHEGEIEYHPDNVDVDTIILKMRFKFPQHKVGIIFPNSDPKRKYHLDVQYFPGESVEYWSGDVGSVGGWKRRTTNR